MFPYQFTVSSLLYLPFLWIPIAPVFSSKRVFTTVYIKTFPLVNILNWTIKSFRTGLRLPRLCNYSGIHRESDPSMWTSRNVSIYFYSIGVAEHFLFKLLFYNCLQNSFTSHSRGPDALFINTTNALSRNEILLKKRSK